MCTNDREQLAVIERLLEGDRRAEILQVLRGYSGQDDDGNRAQSGVGPLVGQERPPIHARHHHIEEDDARRIRVRFIERNQTVGGHVRFEAFARQQLRHHLAEIGIIVDNQNAWTYRRLRTQDDALRIAPVNRGDSPSRFPLASIPRLLQKSLGPRPVG
jgi:hypothetical protein